MDVSSEIDLHCGWLAESTTRAHIIAGEISRRTPRRDRGARPDFSKTLMEQIYQTAAVALDLLHVLPAAFFLGRPNYAMDCLSAEVRRRRAAEDQRNI
jgi:hypothetical protein